MIPFIYAKKITTNDLLMTGAAIIGVSIIVNLVNKRRLTLYDLAAYKTQHLANDAILL